MSSSPLVSQGTLNQVYGSPSLLSVIKFLNSNVYGAFQTASWELVPCLNISLGQTGTPIPRRPFPPSSFSSSLKKIVIYSVVGGAWVPQNVCSSRRTTFRSCFSPSTRDRVQVIRLSNKHLYLLSHFASPSFLLLFFFVQD